MAVRPAGLVVATSPSHIVLVDPTKLKYLAVTVMTAESTVLAKSVRFMEHVSPGCCVVSRSHTLKLARRGLVSRGMQLA